MEGPFFALGTIGTTRCSHAAFRPHPVDASQNLHLAAILILGAQALARPVPLSSSKNPGLLQGCLAVDQVRPEPAARQVIPVEIP